MRNLSTAMKAAITANVVYPALLADLTFITGTVYVWSGIGDLIYNGHTYQGVGSLGEVGTITEGTSVEASGTTISLFGVDPTLYADSIADIRTGLPALIRFGCFNSAGALVDTMILFSGLMDQPTVTENADSLDISIALESKLTNLQRANRRLWTSCEQRKDYPQDMGFTFVEELQDKAIIWGT